MTIKNIYGDRFITTIKNDTYGGIDITVNMNPKYGDLLDWISKFKAEREMEIQLRTTNPVVAAAWEQYQVAVNLTRDAQ